MTNASVMYFKSFSTVKTYILCYEWNLQFLLKSFHVLVCDMFIYYTINGVR